MVKVLVEGGADIEELDDNGMTALMLASLYVHCGVEIVKYLVEHGANVAHKGQWRHDCTPLGIHWWKALVGETLVGARFEDYRKG
jgi:ankyrin repeat protein